MEAAMLEMVASEPRERLLAFVDEMVRASAGERASVRGFGRAGCPQESAADLVSAG
jgi:hypothetical protein